MGFDWKKLLSVGTETAKVFLPGAAGSALDRINAVIKDEKLVNDEDGLKLLAAALDQLAAHVKKLETEVDRLKKAKG